MEMYFFVAYTKTPKHEAWGLFVTLVLVRFRQELLEEGS